MNGYDGLRLCTNCGQYECVMPETRCWRCREQDMIDDVVPIDHFCPDCGWSMTACDCEENRQAQEDLYGHEDTPMWEMYPLELDNPTEDNDVSSEL